MLRVCVSAGGGAAGGSSSRISSGGWLLSFGEYVNQFVEFVWQRFTRNFYPFGVGPPSILASYTNVIEWFIVVDYEIRRIATPLFAEGIN
jgi:hypothetical protein